MGLLIASEVPSGSGELIHVETLPLQVEPNPAFEEAKQLLNQMVASAGSLANSITTDEDYERGMKMIKGIKEFLRNVEEGVEPTKKRINAAKDRVMELLHELDVPAKKLQTDLAKETGRYLLWKQEQVRLENERLARIAELERQKKQREADLDALRSEIQLAQQTADYSNRNGQPETKAEIDAGIKRLVKALENAATTAQIDNLVHEATGVRQLVALAIQHQQARIAAAEAKAAGDKKAAANILKASAKLEVPQVEEVRAEQIQATPIVQRQSELYKAKGAYVRKEWKVKRIHTPNLVPREYCTPSESVLNDYAKRIQQKPVIPGVEFEEVIATKGVR